MGVSSGFVMLDDPTATSQLDKSAEIILLSLTIKK
jgi:hypothetical protein